MPPRDDIILWLDLETTGSRDDARIIEVGCVLTDATPQLSEISTFETIIGPYIKQTEIVDNVVFNMHNKSGLIDALLDPLLPDVHEAEKMLLRWLREHAGTSDNHIPFAGSGVGHFDKKYIQRDWPTLTKKLTYWPYDVGVLRRFLRLAGWDLPAKEGDKPHRALADTLLHVEEARLYLDKLIGVNYG